MVDRTLEEALGRSIRKTNDVDADIGKDGGDSILPGGFKARIEPRVVRSKHYKVTFGSDVLLWDHETQGQWDNFKWSSGSEATSTLYSVYNDYNQFIETLSNDRFFMAASTGVLDVDNETITLGSNTFIESDVVGYTVGSDISSVKINILTTNYNLDDSKIYVGTTGLYDDGFNDYDFIGYYSLNDVSGLGTGSVFDTAKYSRHGTTTYGFSANNGSDANITYSGTYATFNGSDSEITVTEAATDLQTMFCQIRESGQAAWKSLVSINNDNTFGTKETTYVDGAAANYYETWKDETFIGSTNVWSNEYTQDTDAAYSNTYTLQTAVSETGSDEITFTATDKYMSGVFFYVTDKGTGDWAAVLHDSSDSEKAVSGNQATTPVGLNANIVDNDWNFFPLPCALAVGSEYHIHLRSNVADGVIKANTTNLLSSASYKITKGEHQKYITVTIGSESFNYHSGDGTDGFLHQATIDLDTATYSYKPSTTNSGFINGFHTDIYEPVNTKYHMLHGAGQYDIFLSSGYLTYKVNTGLPALQVKFTGPATSATRYWSADYSFDNTNWTEFIGSNDTSGAVGSFNAQRHNEFYIRINDEGGGAKYISDSTRTNIEANLDVSGIPFINGKIGIQTGSNFNGDIKNLRIWEGKELSLGSLQVEDDYEFASMGSELTYQWDLHNNSLDKNYIVSDGTTNGSAWYFENAYVSTSAQVDLGSDFTLFFKAKREGEFNTTETMFYNFNSYSSGSVLVSQRNVSGQNRVRFRYGANGEGSVVEKELAKDQWYDIMWVHHAWDGGSHDYRVYFDGTKIGTGSYSGDEKYAINNLLIGDPNGQGVAIKDVILFNKALDDGDIGTGSVAINEVGSVFNNPELTNWEEYLVIGESQALENAGQRLRYRIESFGSNYINNDSTKAILKIEYNN